MTKDTRKARIDSAEEQVRVMTGAATQINPPENVPLDEGDLVFFHNIIDEFARVEWTPHQIELAAMLARTMADMVDAQQQLREQGWVVYSEKGTPVPNPLKSIVQMHAGTIFSMRRSLSLHATGKTGVQNKDLGNQRRKMKDVEGQSPLNDDDDDLIATPNRLNG